MKKTYFIFLTLMFLLAAYGCKRTDSDVANKKSEAKTTSPKVTSLLKLTSISDQKLAYGTLDSNEKADVWKIHINNLIKSGIYNGEQNKLLVELQDNIHATFFNGSDGRFKLKPFEENWMAKAIKEFKSEDLQNIVLSLSTPSSKETIQIQSAKACGCSTQSDYCGRGKSCGDAYICDASVTGCGFLWDYICNGSCGVPSN